MCWRKADIAVTGDVEDATKTGFFLVRWSRQVAAWDEEGRERREGEILPQEEEEEEEVEEEGSSVAEEEETCSTTAHTANTHDQDNHSMTFIMMMLIFIMNNLSLSLCLFWL